MIMEPDDSSVCKENQSCRSEDSPRNRWSCLARCVLGTVLGAAAGGPAGLFGGALLGALGEGCADYLDRDRCRPLAWLLALVTVSCVACTIRGAAEEGLEGAMIGAFVGSIMGGFVGLPTAVFVRAVAGLHSK
jgi:hypothetical protein